MSETILNLLPKAIGPNWALEAEKPPQNTEFSPKAENGTAYFAFCGNTPEDVMMRFKVNQILRPLGKTTTKVVVLIEGKPGRIDWNSPSARTLKESDVRDAVHRLGTLVRSTQQKLDASIESEKRSAELAKAMRRLELVSQNERDLRDIEGYTAMLDQLNSDLGRLTYWLDHSVRKNGEGKVPIKVAPQNGVSLVIKTSLNVGSDVVAYLQRKFQETKERYKTGDPLSYLFKHLPAERMGEGGKTPILPKEQEILALETFHARRRAEKEKGSKLSVIPPRLEETWAALCVCAAWNEHPERQGIKVSLPKGYRPPREGRPSGQARQAKKAADESAKLKSLEELVRNLTETMSLVAPHLAKQIVAAAPPKGLAPPPSGNSQALEPKGNDPGGVVANTLFEQQHAKTVLERDAAGLPPVPRVELALKHFEESLRFWPPLSRWVKPVGLAFECHRVDQIVWIEHYHADTDSYTTELRSFDQIMASIGIKDPKSPHSLFKRKAFDWLAANAKGFTKAFRPGTGTLDERLFLAEAPDFVPGDFPVPGLSVHTPTGRIMSTAAVCFFCDNFRDFLVIEPERCPKNDGFTGYAGLIREITEYVENDWAVPMIDWGRSLTEALEEGDRKIEVVPDSPKMEEVPEIKYPGWRKLEDQEAHWKDEFATQQFIEPVDELGAFVAMTVLKEIHRRQEAPLEDQLPLSPTELVSLQTSAAHAYAQMTEDEPKEENIVRVDEPLERKPGVSDSEFAMEAQLRELFGADYNSYAEGAAGDIPDVWEVERTVGDGWGNPADQDVLPDPTDYIVENGNYYFPLDYTVDTPADTVIPVKVVDGRVYALQTKVMAPRKPVATLPENTYLDVDWPTQVDSSKKVDSKKKGKAKEVSFAKPEGATAKAGPSSAPVPPEVQTAVEPVIEISTPGVKVGRAVLADEPAVALPGKPAQTGKKTSAQKNRERLARKKAAMAEAEGTAASSSTPKAPETEAKPEKASKVYQTAEAAKVGLGLTPLSQAALSKFPAISDGKGQADQWSAAVSAVNSWYEAGKKLSTTLSGEYPKELEALAKKLAPGDVLKKENPARVQGVPFTNDVTADQLKRIRAALKCDESKSSLANLSEEDRKKAKKARATPRWAVRAVATDPKHLDQIEKGELTEANFKTLVKPKPRVSTGQQAQNTPVGGGQRWATLRDKFKGTGLFSNPYTPKEKEFRKEFDALKKELGPEASKTCLPKLKRRGSGGQSQNQVQSSAPRASGSVSDMFAPMLEMAKAFGEIAKAFRA